MMMINDEGYEEIPIQYENTKCVDPFILIAEVKKHPVLYNKQSEDYDNSQTKDQVWELIHAVLFPNYEELSEEIRETIKVTVRKRWKSLRDALVKDHRLRGEDPAYARKKMSQAVKEMQFLTPFIKYPPRKHNDYIDGNHSPDFCKLMNETTIDLTFPEDSYVDDENIVTNEALYPSVHLTTSEAESEDVGQWKDGFSVSATDAYNQATLKYTIREVEESELKEEEYKIVEQVTNVQKRKRTDSEDDLHSKLNELIDRCNEESQDEDRMFLLSLLSDFKRVPVHRKLKVKSAFVTALYEALD
ncbi:uncharacterized protein LOC129918142 [Episyrphus balteatus]|uniref:uncharacterized protein LOC129918142 n=1 Tax=Episyrphus balteatus TaxID=286459 RepID=UPI0024858903|nr:uncharacterized protein LOC129918142 [Episyrphus balteatus]XP_055854488.1 uncharacterized protein LOC129918142 [Episyrphus balteatus]